MQPPTDSLHRSSIPAGLGGLLSSLGHSLVPASSAPIPISSSTTSHDDGNSPSRGYLQKLERMNQRLVADVQRLQGEVTHLNEDIKLNGKSAVVLLSDTELLDLMKDRDFIVMNKKDYTEFFDRALGDNKERDDLVLAEARIQKFREALQLKLNRWKELYNIVISLEEQLKEVERPKEKQSSVPEIVSEMADRIQGDLKNIFEQIESKFREYEEKVKKLEEEISAFQVDRKENGRLKDKNAMLMKALEKNFEEKTLLQGEMEQLRQTLLSSTQTKVTKEKVNPLQETVDDQARIIIELQEIVREYELEKKLQAAKDKQDKEEEFDKKVIIENYADAVESGKAATREKNQLIASNTELRERIDKAEKNYGAIIRQLHEQLAAEKHQSAALVAEMNRLEKESETLRKKANDYDALKADYDKAIAMLSGMTINGSLVTQAP